MQELLLTVPPQFGRLRNMTEKMVPAERPVVISMTPWLEVDVWSYRGRNAAERLEHGGEEHRAALTEYRRTGGPAVDTIDWAGIEGPTTEGKQEDEKMGVPTTTMSARVDCGLSLGEGDALQRLVVCEARDAHPTRERHMVLAVEGNGGPVLVRLEPEELSAAIEAVGAIDYAELRSAAERAYPPAAAWDWPSDLCVAGEAQSGLVSAHDR
jgi:hypothetical protein